MELQLISAGHLTLAVDIVHVVLVCAISALEMKVHEPLDSGHRSLAIAKLRCPSETAVSPYTRTLQYWLRVESVC